MTNKHIFRRLLNKAISMALWTKAITCVKAGFKSRFCLEHQAGKYKISVNPVILSDFSSCLRVFVAKNLFNQRNPQYGISSTKVYVRKNILFMQNKANFQKVKLNVNKVLTKDYEQMDTWSIETKQSQTNPNKAKLKKAKMNVTNYMSKGYGNKTPNRAPKKQSQTSKRQKPTHTSLPQRFMINTEFSGSYKTNPNKPNFRQFQSKIMLQRMNINTRRKSLYQYDDWSLFDRQMLNRINQFWATNFIS